MDIATITPFGKEVKKRLVDLDRNQSWLIEQVSKRTGLYFDSSYMSKILKGQLCTPKIIKSGTDAALKQMLQNMEGV